MTPASLLYLINKLLLINSMSSFLKDNGQTVHDVFENTVMDVASICNVRYTIGQLGEE